MSGEQSDDPRRRFSNRVENYVKFRPGYPESILTHLKSRTGFSSRHVVADIGSGTGIFSQLLVSNGNTVYGVEPNTEMRRAAESLLQKASNFISVAGSAEATNLQPASVDFIFSAQAFHWFDLERAQHEFRRILVPEGYVVLIWNERKIESPFALAYEGLIKLFGTDYEKVDHRRIDLKVLESFFSRPLEQAAFDYFQDLSEEALVGRVLSASYMPAPDHPAHGTMLKALKRLFGDYETGGRVRLEYITKMYYGIM